MYENRFPNGSKTVLYKKTKLEKFAPHVQEDGLVTRITTYADYDWTVPEYVYEYYSNRVDCLLEVRRNLRENSVVEVFQQGRDDRLKGTFMVFCLQQNNIFILKHIIYKQIDIRGGLEEACWPLVPKFMGSNPAEAIGFLRAKKILSTPSFGGEVKPSVPCRRFP